ncbi:MAG: lysostaphin resistance A-like protein [Roseburia sp.]
MNLWMEKTELIRQSAEKKKGWVWPVEILIAALVYLVCMIGMLIFTMPVELVALFSDDAYRSAAMAGDIAAATDAAMNVAMNSDGLVVWSLFVDIVMIAVLLGFCVLFEKRKPSLVGFTKKGALESYGWGMLLGFVMFSVAELLSWALGGLKITLSDSINWGMIVLFFFGYMIQGMAEEVLCRGYLMVSIARRHPVWVAILTNSLIFAALHLGNPGIHALAFVNLVLFGIVMSLFYLRSGNIWVVGAIHSIWNFVQGNLYGVQVSGTGKTASVFDSVMTEGKELLNGGAFGMEGSILVTILLMVTIILLMFVPKWQKS